MLESMYMQESEFLWWKHGVIYQVYPRSYKDTSGNGVGDLKGVIEKLDYIQSLGVSAIWLNPFFTSPMVDFGYDVADYMSVDPLFGSNTDLLTLIQEAHKRGLKIILDMVLNHTSDQHPWFIESRSSKASPKRDWYVWRDEANNWESIFGGSAWEKCEFSGEYYYHAFLKEQPDLNLRNPEVVEEIKNIFRHYLEMGVDGFRLDAVNTYYEDHHYRDNPGKEEETDNPTSTQDRVYNYDHHLNYELLDELKELVAMYPERMILGEVGREGQDEDAWKKYYGSCNRRLDLVFNFDLLYGELNASRFSETLRTWEGILECKWPSYVLSSHDQIRAISRILPDHPSCTKEHKAKLIALYLLTMRGTPFVYYGEELGMEELTGLAKEHIQDPFAVRNNYEVPTRDGCRTPMLWDDSDYAGFSATKPWLPVHSNYSDICTKNQLCDPGSILHFYTHLISLRNSHNALNKGDIKVINSSENILQYTRVHEGEEILVTLSFCDEAIHLEPTEQGQLLLSSSGKLGELSPYGYELTLLK